MQGLVVQPGVAHSTRVAEVEEIPAREGEVPVRTLEVGVCGTDREISEGLFGEAPGDDRMLILGHELLGTVERDGHGFSRGDLVTATVRRSCGSCLACGEGAPDSCLTGDYSERGITRLHGFAREVVAEDPAHLIAVPPSLGRLGVLAEPASICERGIRHALAIGGRQPWEPGRALVVGAGAIGMLSTYLLRLEGFEVWAASLDPVGSTRAELVGACGARYVSAPDQPIAELGDETGGFDLLIEAAGDAQVMADCIGLLRRSGVACILGIDGRDQTVGIHGQVIGVDLVVQNRVVFGSANANQVDWLAGVQSLDRARERWPEAVAQFVGLRVPLDRFAEAFDYGSGVKATLVLAD